MPIRLLLHLVMILSAPFAAMAGPAFARQPEAPPRLKPGSAEAVPLTPYQWTAAAGAANESEGLRYTWRLPSTYTRGQSYDLVVVCHPAGADFRWAEANLAPAAFRPSSIVVGVNGTSETDDGARTFRESRRDVIDFRDFVLEMTRSFPVDRIFLYGHAEGGAFVVFAASQFPGLTEGVVASASGIWDHTIIVGGIHAVPIAFVHATSDPAVPYTKSIKARDTFAEAGHELLLLRRLDGCDHVPHAALAGECIDWCAGMSTVRADTALAAAESLLNTDRKTIDGCDTTNLFGGAYRILRRVTLETEHQVEESDDDQRAKARAMLERIDAHAARHVELLRKDLKAPSDLVLGLGDDNGAWLGHLLALREDFRGVPAVERFVEEIGFDQAAANQREAATNLLDAWYGPRPEKSKFEIVVTSLSECYLLDSLPTTIIAEMAKLHARANELQLTQEFIENYGAVETWAAARQHGHKRYLETSQSSK